MKWIILAGLIIAPKIMAVQLCGNEYHTSSVNIPDTMVDNRILNSSFYDSEGNLVERMARAGRRTGGLKWHKKISYPQLDELYSITDESKKISIDVKLFDQAVVTSPGDLATDSSVRYKNRLQFRASNVPEDISIRAKASMVADGNIEVQLQIYNRIRTNNRFFNRYRYENHATMSHLDTYYVAYSHNQPVLRSRIPTPPADLKVEVITEDQFVHYTKGQYGPEDAKKMYQCYRGGHKHELCNPCSICIQGPDGVDQKEDWTVFLSLVDGKNNTKIVGEGSKAGSYLCEKCAKDYLTFERNKLNRGQISFIADPITKKPFKAFRIPRDNK